MTSDHSPVYATFRVDTKLAPLPFPSVPCKLVITQLKALTLKYESGSKGGELNPYLVFSGPFLESKVTTEIASKTSPLSWPSTITLQPCLGFKEYLIDQHLFFMIKQKGDDDEIGELFDLYLVYSFFKGRDLLAFHHVF